MHGGAALMGDLVNTVAVASKMPAQPFEALDIYDIAADAE